MDRAFTLIEPKVVPPLDSGFCPAALANRAFSKDVEESGDSIPLVLGLKRRDGAVSRFHTMVFPAELVRQGVHRVHLRR